MIRGLNRVDRNDGDAVQIHDMVVTPCRRVACVMSIFPPSRFVCDGSGRMRVVVEYLDLSGGAFWIDQLNTIELDPVEFKDYMDLCDDEPFLDVRERLANVKGLKT